MDRPLTNTSRRARVPVAIPVRALTFSARFGAVVLRALFFLLAGLCHAKVQWIHAIEPSWPPESPSLF